jgi:signal peptidase II
MLPMMRWLSVAAVVLIVDQLSKAWVASAFRLGESIAVTSYFDMVFVFNRGAAFSFLATGSGWQRWFFTVLALMISAWIVIMLRRHAKERLLPLALALVLGGALGNVTDRLMHGAVIDFLSFHINDHYWPAFNVADSAITIGVALMLLHQFSSGGSK